MVARRSVARSCWMQMLMWVCAQRERNGQRCIWLRLRAIWRCSRPCCRGALQRLCWRSIAMDAAPKILRRKPDRRRQPRPCNNLRRSTIISFIHGTAAFSDGRRQSFQSSWRRQCASRRPSYKKLAVMLSSLVAKSWTFSSASVAMWLKSSTAMAPMELHLLASIMHGLWSSARWSWSSSSFHESGRVDRQFGSQVTFASFVYVAAASGGWCKILELSARWCRTGQWLRISHLTVSDVHLMQDFVG
mmetsp:Transcript_70568/g.165476  ORF Transcript_70568/g.165476 Transcript_70568/m.165476 type:complete len:246 (+) Transcript_70568:552-1289(+)